MNELIFLNNELKKRYGSIKRARSCFLYTEKGVRLTDLYQEGGRAILGWGGGSAFTMLKNALSRGLTGSFLTDYSYRLKKAVNTLLDSDRIIAVFSDVKAAEKACAQKFSNNICFYKPWTESAVNLCEKSCVIIEPPLPWSQGYAILALNNSSENVSFIESLEDTLILPAVLEAAFTRSIYDLISAIQAREEKQWFLYDSALNAYFTRKGPYLYPKVPLESYNDFVIHCLNLGIVISPYYNVPSIVPFGADKGVFSALKKNPFSF